MYKRLKSLFSRYRDIVIYLVFGVLTTLANYAVYLPLYNWAGLSASISNAVAWVFAVAVAFVTNKPFVFHSYDWSAKTVIPELIKFTGCRIGSGLLETGMLLVLVDLLRLDGNLIKLITSVVVVIVNYVGSKWLVFRKK